MKTIGGYKYFGLFEGLPYGDCDEKYDDYRAFNNTVSKESVVKRIESLSLGITSEPTYDLFTGERFYAGFYVDGDYVFTTDFARYYKERDIGLPPKYERYLIDNNFV